MPRRAFTLIELLVVVSIIGILMVLILPGLSKAREIARTAACKSNISAIGKAIASYMGDNKDLWMWEKSTNRWDTTNTGTGLTDGSCTFNSNRAISALLFLLVREGQSPGSFVCPSTSDTPDPNTKNPNGYNWDFNGYKAQLVEHLSYSYQCPIGAMADPNTRSGVDANSEGALIVLADRTPDYTQSQIIGGIRYTSTFNWKIPGINDLRAGMSANHSSGEMINLLYADLHVGDSFGRADCGISSDNIYSAAGRGSDYSQQGTTGMANHSSGKDSYLVGPMPYH
jgi:prepilin-type N-terminal cleavage/methylation domain-containing protein